jgi:hypothetical protein
LKLSTPFNTLTGAWTMRGQKTLVQPRSKACLREKPSAEGDKWRQIRGGKRRQIATSSLPQFDAGADAARFVGRMVKGMVSSENCPQIRAR